MRRIKRRCKAGVSLCCFAILFVLCFHWLSGLIPFVDLRQSRVWRDIYQNKNTVSYAFFGSSHVYCGINPMQIQQKTGKKAVLISSGMQTLAETYYCMEEMLKYQKPEMVFVDLYAAYKEFTETNYTNLDCMRLSLTKVRLAKAAFSDTRLIDALFPLIREHSNWKDFDNLKQNIENRNPKTPYEFGFSGIDTKMSDEQYQGYLAMEYDATPFVLREQDEAMIEKIKQLGEQKNVKVVFLLIPWLEEFTKTIQYDSFLSEMNRATGGMLALTREEYQELGLSRETFIEDKVSDNQHLNLQGAQRYTDFIIQRVILQERER